MEGFGFLNLAAVPSHEPSSCKGFFDQRQSAEGSDIIVGQCCTCSLREWKASQ